MTDDDYCDPIEEAEDLADAEAALAEGGARPAEQVWAELGLDNESATTDGDPHV